MIEPDLPWDGGCLCGKIRLRITAPPLLTSACHCTGCQRLSASAFALSISVPPDGFAITRGSPVIGALHGDQGDYLYCDWCKCWLLTRPRAPLGFVNVRASALDDHGWFAPFVEFWTDEKLPWATTPARHSFATQPDMEAFGPLLAEFTGTSG